MPAVRRLKLIANPVAGSNAESRIARAAELLRSEGAAVELALTRRAGDARRLAAASIGQGYDRLVVAGGDGTLNEAVNGLAHSDLPLAFLPLGTTNVFALEAGIPFDLATACRIALTAPPKPVCLGRTGERYFLLMAGIGFDGETVARVSLDLKRRIGKLAYLASALQVLAGPPRAPLETVDDRGRRFHPYHLILGNARLYGGRFSVTPGADLESDTLQAALFLQRGRLELMRCAWSILRGRPVDPARMRLIEVRELRVEGGPVAVQLDGDFAGRLPMTFKAVPEAVRLILPPQ